ncbi:hypothetical protein ASE33_18165 [Pseudomonas sp. Root9]|nr:hypothetical protein ASE33_18165 [Pseudomonas sp. Root9]
MLARRGTSPLRFDKDYGGTGQHRNVLWFAEMAGAEPIGLHSSKQRAFMDALGSFRVMKVFVGV